MADVEPGGGVTKVEYSKLRMIVADDFSNFRATVSAMLNKLGVGQVESVATGKDVLRLCQAKRYDVVLCDYDMGHGKNGQQVLEELRHRDLLPRSSLFILITADTSRNVVMSAYDCEPDDYMMKPITALALEQRLNRLLCQRAEMMPVHQALQEQNYTLATALLSSKAMGDGRSATYSQKLLGELYLQLGEHDQAYQLYNRVTENRALDWARLGLAKVMRARNEIDLAMETVAKILDDNPLYLPAYDLSADLASEQRDKLKLQRTIQAAVDISPMSILRQQRLGQVAEENQDMAIAAKAFRRSIKLGANSCHARPADNFGFARAVAAAKEKGLEQDSGVYGEALQVLNAAHEHFGLTQEQALQSTILQARVHASQGKADDARRVLEGLGENALASADLAVSIDYVASWQSLGDKQKADQWLNKLLEKHRGDQQALEQLDILLEEPASDSNRKFVAHVNQEGIRLYEQHKFDEAVDRFDQASRLFPNNTGIQLNMAQALLGKLREQPMHMDILTAFNQAMERIETLVDNGHPQYERFNRLKTMARDRGKPLPTEGSQ